MTLDCLIGCTPSPCLAGGLFSLYERVHNADDWTNGRKNSNYKVTNRSFTFVSAMEQKSGLIGVL